MNIRAWLMALRLHTLPASVAPVLVAAGWSVHTGQVHLPALFLALAGAALLQLGTNLINDYQDAVSGADTEDRTGFTRVTQAGLLEPGRVLKGAWICFGLSVIVGGVLAYWGGWPVVVIGLLGLGAAVTYTGGPLPYGYRGLGDPMVFVFFGPVAVVGTVYAQRAALTNDSFWVDPSRLTVEPELWWASLVPACLITAILVVNNHRDRTTDERAGKRTLAVLLGPVGTRIEYVLLLAVGFVVPLILRFGYGVSSWVLLTIPVAPYSLLPLRSMLWSSDGEELNRALTRTGKLAALTCLALGLGLAAG